MNSKQILVSVALGCSLLLSGCNNGNSNSLGTNSLNVNSANKNTLSTTTVGSYDANLTGQIITCTMQESNTGVIYAGTESNGLFISSDKGETWIQKTTANGLKTNTILDIAVVESNVYVITGGTDGSAVKGYAMVSHNGGSTWDSLLDGVDENCSSCNFTSVYAKGNNVYLGSDKTVFNSSEKKYTSTGAFISISHDYGKSWMTTALDANKVKSAYSLNVSESNIYFLDKEARYNGITNMTFIGMTVDSSTNKANIFASHSFWVSNNGISSEILNSIASSKSYIFIATNSGICISTDGGKNFSVKYGLGSSRVYSVAIGSNSIFAGTDNGYSVSYDHGNSWSNYFSTITNQLPGSVVLSLSASSPLLLVGTTNGLAYYNNIDKVTFSKLVERNSIVSSLSSDNTLSLAGTYNQGLQMYDDLTGAIYTNIYNGTNSGIDSNYINAIYGNDANLYVGTEAGLAISKDYGQTWVHKDSSNGLPIGIVTSVSVSGNSIYVGTYGGGLAISVDGGNSWRVVNHSNGLYGDKDVIYDVFADGDWIYVASYQGLSVSSDGGNNWRHYFDNTLVRKVFAVDRYIYVAVDGGIYISTDSANSWSKKNNNLSDRHPRSIFVAAGVVYVGLDNGTLAISLDNGSNFTINQLSSGASAMVDAILPKNGKIIAGSESGVFSNY